MINRKEFERGWNFLANLEGGQISDFVGQGYISRVNNAINDLQKNINSYKGSSQGLAQLGGFIAEDWHASTYNIKAIAAGTDNRAFVGKSTLHASADIFTTFNKDYSLKYLKDANKSINAQAKNVIKNYHEYFSNAKTHGTQIPLSFEEYLEKYEYSYDMEEILQSVYRGQGRIIPSDQLEEGICKLKRLIAIETTRGTENRLYNLKNYEETLSQLSDRIKSNDGIESIPLTKKESMVIAELCKTGEFKPDDFGITLDTEIINQYILNQALKAGITSTVVSLAIKIVPEIIDMIDELVKDKSIDLDEIRESGLKIVSVGVKSFIIGYMSCVIYTACKVGKMGATFTNIEPGIIGTIVALTYNIMIDSFEYASGKISKQEMNCRITKNMIISVSSLVSGTISVSLLPLANALSFVIGSMIGSVVSSVLINKAEKVMISFCVETGYTLFGLVKQDYTIPIDALKGMGLKIADLNKIEMKKSNLRKSTLHRTSLKKTQIKKVDIQIMKRGIIAFNCIGYVF